MLVLGEGRYPIHRQVAPNAPPGKAQRLSGLGLLSFGGMFIPGVNRE